MNWKKIFIDHVKKKKNILVHCGLGLISLGCTVLGISAFELARHLDPLNYGAD